LTEKRSKMRFPLELPLKFTGTSKGTRIQGTGTVLSISSEGVAFRTDQALGLGMKVTASFGWPVMLNNQCMLQISTEGEVIRIDGSLIVVRIRRYEFRTSGSNAFKQSRNLLDPSGDSPAQSHYRP
jgi:hypothetical protein